MRVWEIREGRDREMDYRMGMRDKSEKWKSWKRSIRMWLWRRIRKAMEEMMGERSGYRSSYRSGYRGGR